MFTLKGKVSIPGHVSMCFDLTAVLVRDTLIVSGTISTVRNIGSLIEFVGSRAVHVGSMIDIQTVEVLEAINLLDLLGYANESNRRLAA